MVAEELKCVRNVVQKPYLFTLEIGVLKMGIARCYPEGLSGAYTIGCHIAHNYRHIAIFVCVFYLCVFYSGRYAAQVSKENWQAEEVIVRLSCTYIHTYMHICMYMYVCVFSVFMYCSGSQSPPRGKAAPASCPCGAHDF